MAGSERRIYPLEGFERRLDSLPVVILTGFLGSGKTTRLRQFLEHPSSPPTAVIVNEYGDQQVDGDLIEYANADSLVETTTGCVCCTISGDVRSALLSFSNRARLGELPGFEQVIIETTGLADPAPLIHALLQDEQVRELYHLDRVVCVSDAIRGESWFHRFDEFQRQIALADIILISKADLIDDPISKRELSQFIARLSGLNPIAESLPVSAATLGDALAAPLSERLGRHQRPSHHGHSHGHGPQSFSVMPTIAVDLASFSHELSKLVGELDKKLLRIEGMVPLESGGNLLVQGVAGHLQSTIVDDSGRPGRLVFIFENLNPAHIIEALTDFMDFKVEGSLDVQA